MLSDLCDREQVFTAIEGSWYALVQRFACLLQSEVYEDQYLKRVYTGIPWGFDGVFMSSFPDDMASTVIRESIHYFEQRNHPFAGISVL